ADDGGEAVALQAAADAERLVEARARSVRRAAATSERPRAPPIRDGDLLTSHCPRSRERRLPSPSMLRASGPLGRRLGAPDSCTFAGEHGLARAGGSAYDGASREGGSLLGAIARSRRRKPASLAALASAAALGLPAALVLGLSAAAALTLPA